MGLGLVESATIEWGSLLPHEHIFTYSWQALLDLPLQRGDEGPPQHFWVHPRAGAGGSCVNLLTLSHYSEGNRWSNSTKGIMRVANFDNFGVCMPPPSVCDALYIFLCSN